MAIPESFLCPILRTLMTDPYITNCGHTFQKDAIDDWVRRKGGLGVATCPVDRTRVTNLVKNFSLKASIDSYQAQNSESQQRVDQTAARFFQKNEMGTLRIIGDRMKQDANLSVLEDIPEQPLGDIAFQRKIIAKAQICLPREPLNLFLSLSSEFIERHLDLLGQIAILFMARAENVDLFRTLPEEVRNNADFLTSVISGMRTCHIGGADSVLRALRSDFVLTHRDLVMQMLAWYGETRDCLAIFSEIPNAMQMDLTFTIDVVRQAKAQKIPFAIDEIQQHVPEEHKEILRKEWEKGCCCTIL